MDNISFYTKGDKEDIVSRIGQVHTITMFCPLNDMGVCVLKNFLSTMCPDYRVADDVWMDVPTIDALRTFLCASTLGDAEMDRSILGLIYSSLRMFKKLKLINFEFTYDEEIENTYKLLLKKEKEGINKYIYRVDVLEMNLSDMFSQWVIDLVNRVFICNEYISNSYLNKTFKIEFTFDEYTSFMNMFLSNNHDRLNALDNKICDYFMTFPKLVNTQKPNIRILTNYNDEAIF